MALWQYTLRIVPKFVLQDINGNLSTKIDVDPDGFLNTPVWDISPFREKILPLIENYLPKGVSWSKEIAIWGKDDETCLSISNSEQDLIELTVRLDLRSLNSSILELLEKLAAALDALGIGEDGNIFHLNRQALSKELKASRAFKFVSNPHGFLSELEQEKKRE